jgi:hypothetical protein
MRSKVSVGVAIVFWLALLAFVYFAQGWQPALACAFVVFVVLRVQDPILAAAFATAAPANAEPIKAPTLSDFQKQARNVCPPHFWDYIEGRGHVCKTCDYQAS